MKPYKKSKIVRETMYRKEYKVETRGMRELYWDDGIKLYPRFNRGSKTPLKRLMAYQIRMYKTWKHNRKTRWK